MPQGAAKTKLKMSGALWRYTDQLPLALQRLPHPIGAFLLMRLAAGVSMGGGAALTRTLTR